MFAVLRTRTPLHFTFFFFNDTATTEIYTLSLHDALPIYGARCRCDVDHPAAAFLPDHELRRRTRHEERAAEVDRSEEHTSELQSQSNLVCRLLLEKKKKMKGDRREYKYKRDTL